VNVEDTPDERIDLMMRRYMNIGPGRHRSIRQHAFVLYRNDANLGCGHDVTPDDEDYIRCGYGRTAHPTMLNPPEEWSNQ
jgi:hypothetical protein